MDRQFYYEVLINWGHSPLRTTELIRQIEKGEPLALAWLGIAIECKYPLGQSALVNSPEPISKAATLVLEDDTSYIGLRVKVNDLNKPPGRALDLARAIAKRITEDRDWLQELMHWYNRVEREEDDEA